jgi:dexamethasone-induced Ras-related protein 1
MIKKISPSENEFNIPAKNCHRMVILGSTKVGKTAIISRFLNKKVDDQYTPTIEDFHRKLYSIRGDAYQLDILDTSGNHPFPAMRRLSILTGKLNCERMKQTNVYVKLNPNIKLHSANHFQ